MSLARLRARIDELEARLNEPPDNPDVAFFRARGRANTRSDLLKRRHELSRAFRRLRRMSYEEIRGRIRELKHEVGTTPVKSFFAAMARGGKENEIQDLEYYLAMRGRLIDEQETSPCRQDVGNTEGGQDEAETDGD